MTDFHPLHDPVRDAGTGWVPSLDLAVDCARDALAKHQGADIRDQRAMLGAAVALEKVLRDLLAAFDQENAKGGESR
ncbi:hypothetical protein ACWEFL_28065 [Streptomyces sp. NPDC004838]